MPLATAHAPSLMACGHKLKHPASAGARRPAYWSSRPERVYFAALVGTVGPRGGGADHHDTPVTAM